jgi:hypothetical protein
LLLGLFVVFALVQPFEWWPRFTWWIVPLGAIAFFGLVDWSGPLQRGILTLAYTLLAAWAVLLPMSGAVWRWTRFREAVTASPVSVIAGEAANLAYAQSGATIAVPDLDWGPWNLYLRGHALNNDIEVLGVSERGSAPDELPGSGDLLFVPSSFQGPWTGVRCLQPLVVGDRFEHSLYKMTCD